MSATYTTPGLGHRLGRSIRRGLGKLKAFELGVARRAGEKFPSIGHTVARILFLILKLAVFVVLFLTIGYFAICLLIFFGIVKLMGRATPVEITNWEDQEVYERQDTVGYDDVYDIEHPLYWGNHPIYDEDKG